LALARTAAARQGGWCFPARGTATRRYLTSADGLGPRRITNTTADEYYPELSGNGQQVVFTSKRTGNAEIFVAGTDGGNALNLSNDPGDDDWARWSPNGRQVVFHSNRDGNYELYLVNVDGTGLTRLTNYGGVDQWADWSPDGKRLAFRRDVDVYLMDLDGGNLGG
jgi:Tol biopolymer transport system component